MRQLRRQIRIFLPVIGIVTAMSFCSYALWRWQDIMDTVANRHANYIFENYR